MAELAADCPREAFTEDTARLSLTQACQKVGLTSQSAMLIRLGSNAVFRLDSATIARVAPSASHLANAEKQIAVARWLESVGYPATRAIDIPQPVEAQDRVVTFWESVSLETVYAPIADVAALIKRLHALVPPADLALPELVPFGRVGDPLPQFPGLPTADAEYLRSRIEWARKAFPLLPFELPPGVIHGDANVGNVLVDDNGCPVLIDLDSVSTGPREWDLVQTALFSDRLGWHTREEYRTFVDVYGYDLMEWTGYPRLADMREIAMITWLSRKATASAGAGREARKRITAIRSGGSRRDWGAY
jgi:hypothetical protein